MPLFIRYVIHGNTYARHLVSLPPFAYDAQQVRGGAGKVPPHLP